MAEGWQRTWVRVTLTLLTLGVMLMIFLFSMQDAARSDMTSGRITAVVIRILYPGYPEMTADEQARVFDEVQHAVRKCAHFSEYTLLGFLTRLCLESWFGKKGREGRMLNACAWLWGTLYACTDEIHQLRIAGRSGQWTDVLIDSCGVLAGILPGVFLIRRARRGKQGTGEKTE